MGDVCVGYPCSFRVHHEIEECHPSVRVQSNEVSLLSCGLGALATDSAFPSRFCGRPGSIEDAVGKDQVGSFFERLAADLMALSP